MPEELNRTILEYKNKWDRFAKNKSNPEFFKGLVPTAVGWKVQDLAEFDERLTSLREHCEQIHVAWINGRWLATLHLRSTKLEWDIEVIKLMQRRPGSSDKTGLDHIDFFTEQDIVSVLKKESGLEWSEESNNPLCSWISLRFDGTEAKLRNNTVLDVCIKELQIANERIVRKTRV